MRVLLIAAAALIVSGCANPQPEASPRATTAPSPAGPTNPAVRVIGQKAGGKRVQISEFTHNRLVYRIFADSSTYDSRTHEGTFSRADGNFYGNGRSKGLHVIAPVAIIDQASKSVAMSGGVRAAAADGTTLSCDRMLYVDATQRVRGSGNVRLQKDGNVVTGDKIDADLQLEQYKVTGS